MAEAKRIAFNGTQYDQLIARLGTLITDLQNVTTAGSAPLSDDTKLQPDGQTWKPAIDLVAAGQKFFGGERGAVDEIILPELTKLHQGLINAKGLFANVEDLATISTADFMAELNA